MASKVAAEAGAGPRACWTMADFKPATVLSRGSYGKVKFADHAHLGRVAMKELTRRPQWCDGFYREEFDKLARLSHAHVVRIHGVVLEPGIATAVMEVAEHGSLRSLIQRLEQGPRQQRLPMVLVNRIIYQVADGMTYMHGQPQSVLHGNLNADSILIFQDWIAKITGFGLLNSASCSEGERQTTEELVSSFSSGISTLTSAEIINSGRKRDVYDFSIFIWWLLCHDPAARDKIETFTCAHTETNDVSTRDLRGDSRVDVFNMMTDCWSANESIRPTFSEITARMATIMSDYDDDIAGRVPPLTSAMSDLEGMKPTEREIADSGGRPSHSEQLGSCGAASASGDAPAEAMTGALLLPRDPGTGLRDPDSAVCTGISGLAQCKIVPERLHVRALRRAESGMIAVFRNYSSHAAFTLHSWELLDSPEHLLGDLARKESAAARLMEAIYGKDEFTTVAFLSVLLKAGLKRVVEPYLSALWEENRSEEDQSDLVWWSILLKTDGLSFAEAESWLSRGIINDDDYTVAKVLPPAMQQLFLFMSCLTKSEKAEEELGKLHRNAFPDAALPTQGGMLRKVSFLSRSREGPTQHNRGLPSQLVAAASGSFPAEDSIKDVVEWQTCLRGDFNEKGGSLSSMNKSVTLKVPTQAVKGKQEISLNVSIAKNTKEGAFSLEFECRSSVKRFIKPIQLTVPHCAPEHIRLVAAIRPMDSDEFVQSTMDVTTDANIATIFLNQPCIFTLIGQPCLSQGRHWWLSARMHVPLYVFGYLYPNTGVARIYCARMFEDLCEEKSQDELTSGGRYVLSQRLNFMLCPENGALIFEEQLASTNPMTHPVKSMVQEPCGCITLPMRAATGKVRVYQELGGGEGVLLFGDGSAERLPSSAAGQTISTFEMETLFAGSSSQESSTVSTEAVSEADESAALTYSGATVSEQKQSDRHEAEDKKDEVKFSSATGKFMAPLWCRDIAVSAEGTPLLAAGWDGVKEYDGSGKEVSSWTTKTDLEYNEWVVALDAAPDGRVAVGLWYSHSVAVLRRNPDNSQEWIEDKRVKDVQADPWRVSVCGDILAVAEGVPHHKLALINIPRDQQIRMWKLDYAIQCLIVTEKKTVIMASLGKVRSVDPRSPGREMYVIDCCDQDGNRLWRHDRDEKAWDLCASPSGRVVYLALNDSNKVEALNADNGSHLADVVTKDHHGLEMAWRLSMSCGPRIVIGVISFEVRKGR